MGNNRGRKEAEAIARRYAEKREACNPSAADSSAPDWRNRARATSLARRYAKIKRAADNRRPAETELEPDFEEGYGFSHSGQAQHSSPEQLEQPRRARSKGTARAHYSSTEELDEIYRPHHSSPEQLEQPRRAGSQGTARVHYSSTEELDETYRPHHSSPPRAAKPMAFSRDREEIARGKRPVKGSGEPFRNKNVEPESKEANTDERTEPKLTAKEMRAVFLARGFAGTRYPHLPTMKKLGIDRDVSCLFALGGLTKFMNNNSPAYRTETCHFLSTLQVHFYEENPEYISDGGLGWITFKVRGKLYSITTTELDDLYGFQSGAGSEEEFAKEELQSLWRTIAVDAPYSSSRSKSSQIRHPAVRYLHKSIASTMFARQVTGPVNQSELQVMDSALKGILEFAKDGRELLGDRNDTSLTFTLLDQFLNYREWAVRLHRKNTKGELSIGGVITPILVACQVPLISEPSEPRWLDIDYLRKAFFLNKTSKKAGSEECLYQFVHPTAGPAQLLLPCAAVEDSLDSSIDFSPPLELLYQPPQEYPQRAQEGDGLDHPARSNSSSATGDAQPESFHFEEYPAQKQHKGLWEAHKRIGLLQKWNKVQDKTIKALKSTVKELTEGWKEMKEQLSKLQGKSKSSPHEHEEAAQPSTVRRSDSMNIGSRRSTYDEPPRYSSYEPRQKKRQVAGTSRASKRRDQHLRPQQPPPAPAYSREDMEESSDF